MKLEILKEKEFLTFVDNNPLKTFMQTKEIGAIREKNGWNKIYLGLKENKKIVAATMLLSKTKYFGKKEFYALRGPLLDFENENILNTFLEGLIKYSKENNGYILRMDPYLVYKERDGKGNIIEDGIDNSKIVENIKRLGFKKVPQSNEEQVSFMYALDIENKTEDEIFKNMQQTTRNIIRKTMKHGIEIKELTLDEIDEFYNIMIETGKRKGFSIRSLDYHKNMYKEFSKKDEIKFLVSKLNLDKNIEILEKEKAEQITKRNSLSESKSNDGKRKALDEAINGIDKKINQAKELKEKHGNIITLSGSMFILTKPEVIYLSSGNYEEFLMYNSQYLIQWEMIKYAINNGYKRYNFYGIPSTFDKNDKDYGIYEFKTGFNGYVEQLIGEYEKPLSLVYYLIKFIKKIKR